MGIIDFNIEKPSWKRTNVEEPVAETDSTTSDETSASQTGSRDRLRRVGRVAGGLGLGVVSLLTLRTLRRRRGKKDAAAEPAE